MTIDAAPSWGATPRVAPKPTATPSVFKTATTGQTAGKTAAASTPTGAWRTLSTPIDPAQQTGLSWCDRSHWLQPWRAYLDTRPTTALRDAVGVNLNVPADQTTAAATLLASQGFKRARTEMGWDVMDYADPSKLRDPTALRARLVAIKNAGLRPLILLNANHGRPGPIIDGAVLLSQRAEAGARTLELDPASAAVVVPGLSGLKGGGRATDVIFTAVDGNTVTLSKPLDAAVDAGWADASVLRYEPFGKPFNADGTRNARFEASLDGWFKYVDAVTSMAKSAVGGSGFDVEIWNEETFGSDFLYADRYYSPVPQGLDGTGDVRDVILRRTVARLRESARGLSGMGIGDGFANQTPFAAGSTSPVGLTAIDKHPYTGPGHIFGAGRPAAACRPKDARGQVDGTTSDGNNWTEAFTPSYVDWFPEYYLSAIQGEHLIRDLSPITTKIGSTDHGRNTKPSGGTPPQMWITEHNQDLYQAALTATSAEGRRVQAKAALRSLVSFVNKGVSALYLYAALGDQFGIVDPAQYATGGGLTLESIGRMLQRFPSAAITTPRSLTLRSIADYENRYQFQGDGTAAHPTLYDREVTAVLPFQSGNKSFVIPAYVMTRNVKDDLPASPYRIELGGLNGSTASVSAYDPLTNQTVAVSVVSRSSSTLTVQLPLTDSPRLLLISNA